MEKLIRLLPTIFMILSMLCLGIWALLPYLLPESALQNENFVRTLTEIKWVALGFIFLAGITLYLNTKKYF